MHDQNFKNLILDYPHQALAFFAADEFSEVDQAARATPVRQEQLKGRSPLVIFLLGEGQSSGITLAGDGRTAPFPRTRLKRFLKTTPEER